MQEQNWQVTVKREKPEELAWVLRREEAGTSTSCSSTASSSSSSESRAAWHQLLAKAMRNRADELPQMLGIDLGSN